MYLFIWVISIKDGRNGKEIYTFNVYNIIITWKEGEKLELKTIIFNSLKYIEENINEPISSEDVAKNMKM